MKKLLFATAFLLTLVPLAATPAQAEEATFTRSLTVTGRVDLTVATGSGSIHLTSGPAGRVQIFGRVKSNWGGSDAQVHEIADHPPIEQTGNIVHIGTRHESYRSISIDYEIQVPPNAFLTAESGSGNLTDDGVGANARLTTGSGSIHATGLQGGFSAGTYKTGGKERSGNVEEVSRLFGKDYDYTWDYAALRDSLRGVAEAGGYRFEVLLNPKSV